jgi:hypothetical protein
MRSLIDRSKYFDKINNIHELRRFRASCWARFRAWLRQPDHGRRGFGLKAVDQFPESGRWGI